MDESTVPRLRTPLVLAAFDGWNDAGEAASGALDHLHELWMAQPLGEIDPEEYHDFQVTRPQVSLDAEGRRTITWPITRLSWARPEGSEHDIVLVRGYEPSMRWRHYVDEVLSHLEGQQPSMLLALGALLADVPHTRPIPVSSTSDDPDLLARLTLEKSTYEGPTGIVGILMDEATRRGVPAMSMWAAVPHYVRDSPSPKAVLALLSRIEEVVGVPLPLQELGEEAQAWEHGVDELAAEDDEIAEYVRQLEQARDTTELPEASGEAIARDFERYLRRRGNNPR